MTTQPRVLRPGMHGPDVYVMKRALHKWAKHAKTGTAIAWPVHNGRYDTALAGTLKEFQHAHTIMREPQRIGPKSYAQLLDFTDLWGLTVLKVYAAAHQVTVVQKRKKAFKAELLWGIANTAGIGYSMDGATREHGRDMWQLHHLPFKLDCSMGANAAAERAGLPDPAGQDYRRGGTVYTGTYLSSLDHIPSSKAKALDHLVFGAGDGDHIVVLLEDYHGPSTLCYSHGQEYGPDRYTVQEEINAHPGMILTFLKTRFT